MITHRYSQDDNGTRVLTFHKDGEPLAEFALYKDGSLVVRTGDGLSHPLGKTGGDLLFPEGMSHLRELSVGDSLTDERNRGSFRREVILIDHDKNVVVTRDSDDGSMRAYTVDMATRMFRSLP